MNLCSHTRNNWSWKLKRESWRFKQDPSQTLVCSTFFAENVQFRRISQTTLSGFKIRGLKLKSSWCRANSMIKRFFYPCSFAGAIFWRLATNDLLDGVNCSCIAVSFTSLHENRLIFQDAEERNPSWMSTWWRYPEKRYEEVLVGSSSSWCRKGKVQGRTAAFPTIRTSSKRTSNWFWEILNVTWLWKTPGSWSRLRSIRKRPNWF